MELRRSAWAPAIHLAITLSVIAVAVAVALRAAGVVPQPAIVLGVIVVGFATSWVRTAPAAEPRPVRCHRVATVPARHVPAA